MRVGVFSNGYHSSVVYHVDDIIFCVNAISIVIKRHFSSRSVRQNLFLYVTEIMQ